MTPIHPGGTPPLLRVFRRTPRTEEQTEQALERTRRTWFSGIGQLFSRARIDDELWEELEELLLGADVGVATTQKVLERVQERVGRERVREPEGVRDLLKQELAAILDVGQERGQVWSRRDGAEGTEPRPAVILVVGVNGTGKTTTIGKLAWALTNAGNRVVVAAADTFRAAAIEQVREWGEKAGAEVVGHRQGADPGAVVFDALAAAEARQADAVIIDTAGRLHTKFNLMEELAKVRRVIQRRDESAPHEVLLVLDATTGQNALLQARAFTEAVDVTGIALTKLDGTARGGIVFAICDQLGLPVRFVGTGERPEDLAPFDAGDFVDGLFS